jgi:hypothetical protein
MHAFFLFTGSGPIVILSSHRSINDPTLLSKLAAKGIGKFIAYSIPIELARSRYGQHFDVVSKDLDENDDLRVLDFDGTRAFHLFRFNEMGPPITHEGAKSRQG